MSDPGPVFGALADPTRREMVATLLRDGTTSVPALTAALPITRQAVAKHLAALRAAELVRARRVGRETRFDLAPEPLEHAAAWIAEVGAAWDARLERLGRLLGE